MVIHLGGWLISSIWREIGSARRGNGAPSATTTSTFSYEFSRGRHDSAPGRSDLPGTQTKGADCGKYFLLNTLINIEALCLYHLKLPRKLPLTRLHSSAICTGSRGWRVSPCQLRRAGTPKLGFSCTVVSTPEVGMSAF